MGQSGAVLDEVKVATRRMSDWQLTTARMLLEAERSGEWRQQYASFDEYVSTELDLLPGWARELMRVQRKVEAVCLSPDEAREIGYGKLRTVASKMTPANSREVLADLRSTTIRAVRSKYCPSTPRKRPSSVSSTTACHERDPRGECGAAGAEPEAVLVATENNRPDIVAETVPNRRASRGAGLGSAEKSSGAKGRAPRQADASQRVVQVSWFMALALNVAQRHAGPSNDEMLFTFICSIFISIMGSDAEKKWIREEVPAELARRQAAKSGSPSQSRDPASIQQRPDHTTTHPPRPDVDVALDVDTPVNH